MAQHWPRAAQSCLVFRDAFDFQHRADFDGAETRAGDLRCDADGFGLIVRRDEKVAAQLLARRALAAVPILFGLTVLFLWECGVRGFGRFIGNMRPGGKPDRPRRPLPNASGNR